MLLALEDYKLSIHKRLSISWNRKFAFTSVYKILQTYNK